VQLAPTKLQA